jgi:uncharacterized protein YggE
MKLIKRQLLLVCMAILAGVPATGFAQGKTITVTGSGKATVRPDTVLIYGTIAGTAKSADEALVKFQQAKRRLLEAVAKSELEGLTAAGNGVAIQTSNGPVGQNPAVIAAEAFGNNQPKPADARYIVKEQIALKLTGIDQAKDEDVFENVLTLVGIAEDHGAQLSNNSNNARMMMMFGNRMETEVAIAIFQVSDPSTLHQKAYEAAVAAGAKRVKIIAGITKTTVGSLVSIEEISVGGVKADKDPTSMMQAVYGIDVEEQNGPEYSAKELGEIECEVILKLTFEITK